MSEPARRGRGAHRARTDAPLAAPPPAGRTPGGLKPEVPYDGDPTRNLWRRVARVSEVRFDKVEAICRQLAAGTYAVEPRRLADRILAHLASRS